MKQNTKRTSSILLALLLLVGSLIGYFDFVVPSYSALENEKGQLLGEQALYQNEKQLSVEIQKLKNTYDADASSTQTVNLALPVGEDLSGALAQVYGLANNANVGITTVGVSVQEVSPADQGGNGSALQSAAATGLQNPVGTITLQLAGSASYESFKQFLQELEDNIRIFDVEGITLTPSPLVQVTGKGATTVNQDLFNYTMSVNTYYESGQTSSSTPTNP